jgi:hypothetical protein
MFTAQQQTDRLLAGGTNHACTAPQHVIYTAPQTGCLLVHKGKKTAQKHASKERQPRSMLSTQHHRQAAGWCTGAKKSMQANNGSPVGCFLHSTTDRLLAGARVQKKSMQARYGSPAACFLHSTTAGGPFNTFLVSCPMACPVVAGIFLIF